ncbi:MAG TPA: hypothetical protein VL356_09285 [Acidocella sp.]|jgi:hypothetical protein|nr:hypothetical protein [Acidocella sp.]
MVALLPITFGAARGQAKDFFWRAKQSKKTLLIRAVLASARRPNAETIFRRFSKSSHVS